MTRALSRRTDLASAENVLTRLLREARSRGPVLDLTASNPTTARLPYAEDEIRAALSDARCLVYAPSARGTREAREAISAFYMEELGAAVDPDRVVLVASTSEAYAMLFKVLCDPGDVVLAPRPSYPLFDHLAACEAVRLAPYTIAYDGRWHVDIPSLRAGVTPDVRAILAVSPNNPTGSYLARAELDAMLAAGLPLVVDEVFAQYPLGSRVPAVRSVCAERGGLCFALSGLSKLGGLPQMKLAWIVVSGEPSLVDAALARLDVVCDAFLSVGAPVQVALPRLLAAGRTTREGIQRRIAANLRAVAERTRDRPVTLLDVEGGWYAILRLPATRSEETWAEGLLREHAVYTHPGYFFDMATEPHLVVSLLAPPEVLDEGVERLLSHVAEGC